ncbi:formate dehydrogenase subunit delta [Variovorax sp. PBL-E5]|uniref:formate dehydrogenase subunit delta n=1 Tax=Variovorax sp. PBL-E5 TaxID=434014 RepID=UPI001315B678|nr:formate dehydrogenase subunit delta [Variovorax sp. PBL-E5]VTU29314.1 NADH-dependant formate dehydrogenase delta subunit FdsD [Variovorax sp. PBL-E5]
MQVDNLIRMANQIGSFFEAMPDRPQALKDIALHIRKFWDPRMRRAFLEHVDQTGGAALSEVLGETLRLHRDILDWRRQPATARSASP